METKCTRHRMSSAGRFYILMLLLVSACSSPDDTRGERAALLTAYLAHEPAGEVPEPIITNIRHDGSLCPEGTGDVMGVESGIGYEYAFVISPTAEASDGTCVVSADIRIPAGYQMRSPYVAYEYHAIGSVTLSTRTSINNVERSDTPLKELVEGSTISFEEVVDESWSSSCANPTSDTELHLEHAMNVELEQGSSLDLQVSARFWYDDGIEWARCGDDGPFVPAAAEEGRPCRLRPSRPCAAGLVCELDDRGLRVELNEGTCVDPEQRLDKQPAGEICNGVREIECDDGLVCAFSRPEREAEGARGTCRAKLAQEDERCDGHPDIQCVPGTVCVNVDAVAFCYSGTGELHSRCGDGLPACGVGLTCQGSGSNARCEQHAAGTDESCAPELKVRCGRFHVCDPGTLTCVRSSSSHSAMDGESCVDDLDCEEHLACFDGICDEPGTRVVGASCRGGDDCLSGACESGVCTS